MAKAEPSRLSGKRTPPHLEPKQGYNQPKQPMPPEIRSSAPGGSVGASSFRPRMSDVSPRRSCVRICLSSAEVQMLKNRPGPGR
jgi:hypothetical protein